ncbi:MAG: hypothetical protein RJB60_2967, partial [Pseudomonadota bacterium]|jgi:hypothetical protein
VLRIHMPQRIPALRAALVVSDTLCVPACFVAPTSVPQFMQAMPVMPRVIAPFGLA